jgi:hypothetical protein
MDTTLSVGLRHASCKFTIVHKLSHSVFSKTAAIAFSSQISRKDNGGSSCENSKIGNKSFPESRNVTMSHGLCLLFVTGNYISELIILIILKSCARQRRGYQISEWRGNSYGNYRLIELDRVASKDGLLY